MSDKCRAIRVRSSGSVLRITCCVARVRREDPSFVQKRWRPGEIATLRRPIESDPVKASPTASQSANWAGVRRLKSPAQCECMRVDPSPSDQFFIFMKLDGRAGNPGTAPNRLCANGIVQGASVWCFKRRFGLVPVGPTKSDQVQPKVQVDQSGSNRGGERGVAAAGPGDFR